MWDAVISDIVTNARLAVAVVPFLQWLRKRGTLPVRLARVWSATLAAVGAAGITYTFDQDTGDLALNVYVLAAALPRFAWEFAKQFGIQELLYRVLQRLFATDKTFRR